MDLSNLLEMQGELLLLMVVGLFLTKIGMISRDNRKLLTDLVVDVTLPCSIVKSFDVAFQQEILTLGGVMVIANILVQLGSLLLARLFFHNYPDHQRNVLKYATVISNAGILGNPVAEGAFGSMGLLYASIYLIPQRIFMWSIGISLFTGKMGSRKETIKKVLTHPCIVAVAIGLVLLMSPLTLPPVLKPTVGSIGSANTALSMLLVGSLLGDIPLNKIVDKDTVVYSGVRLFLIPAIALTICKLTRIDALAAGVIVLLTAMPAASTTAVLASKYGRDTELASKLVALSTILSVATAPVWCLFTTM